MMKIFNRFTYLWNDLPKEERFRMAPYLDETHLIHIEQMKAKIIASHKSLIRQLDEQQAHILRELNKGVNKQ